MGGRFAGELAALVTAVCWTGSALSFEAAGKRVGSAAVNLLRMPLAFALLSLTSLAARGLPLPSDAPARAWVWLSVSGLVGLVAGDLLLFRAFVVLGSRLSMLVMTLVPILTALFGRIVLGETLSALKLAAMAVTLTGVGVAVAGRGKGGVEGEPVRSDASARRPLSGAGLALGGAVGQAMGLVLSKHGMGGYDPFASTQIREIAAVAAYLVLFSALGVWPKVAAAVKDRGAMLFIALGSFFGPFLGVAFSLISVQNAATGVASTIMALVPVLIIPPSVLLLRERATAAELAGACAAVGGVALLFLF